jgi:hypothetical protein
MPHFDGSKFLLKHEAIHAALEGVMGKDHRFVNTMILDATELYSGIRTS